MTESRPSDIFKPGDLLNNTYRIEAILGRGGTSEVYQARNDISKRLVAIKALKSEFADNEDYLTLMTREEEIREIRHDSVVRYSENHRTKDGVIYLVMDYVEGPALEAVMKRGGMDAPDLLKVIERVAQGLQAAHRRNIVHRDLSPDNIILRGGDPGQAVIIDFGIAKDTNPEAKTIIGNAFAGKYGYAAPEQLSGHSDPRTDIYSLGALILATFRGSAPKMGANPMEVVQNKAKPLDTEGVPEPLKSLIDRMSDPIPERRFQSADELLAALEPGLDERTVISPAVRKPAAPPAEARATRVDAKKPDIIGTVSSTAKPAKEKRGGGGVLILLLLLVVLGGGAAAAWFTGAADPLIARFMGPKLPVADPYSLIVEKQPDTPPRAVGFAPSQEVQAALTQAIAQDGGTADLSLATGAIGETWGADVLAVLKLVAPLDEWRVAVNGNAARITGVTRDADLKAVVEKGFADGLPGVLEGNAAIVLGPVTVTAAMLRETIAPFEDCGELTVKDIPATGFGQGATITVAGRLTSTEKRVALFDALTAAVGDRKVQIETEVLNPALCAVEASLPRVEPAGVGFRFGFGDRSDPNPNARYFVGENPVIDLVLPASMTSGFLYVAIIDVTGSVFHVLPRRTSPDNAVETLRGGATGDFTLRIAFPAQEALDDPAKAKLAFTVDASILGKSKIVVIHSDRKLFEEAQPREESVAAYAEALAKNKAEAGITSLDSAILVTADN